MNKFKHIILQIALFIFISNPFVYGQISREGTPPGMKYKLENPVAVKTVLPDIDFLELSKEDAISKEAGLPMRAGFSIPMGIDIEKDGIWEVLPNGDMLWRIEIRTEGAASLGLVFDRFELPEASELYIYTGTRKHYVGSFGSHNNNEAGVFSTHVLPGDTLIVEYLEKAHVYNQNKRTVEGNDIQEYIVGGQEPFKCSGILRITELIYVYQGSPVDKGGKDLGDSESCEVNINCSPVGDTWQDAKRGIARILFREGTSWYWCTGSLVNNTMQNGAPYFLTADHCGGSASAYDRSVWQFYFNYERFGCLNIGTPPTNMIVGCEMLSRGNISGGSDFLLVRLGQEVPLEWNPYFNGWDRSTTGSPSGAVIHHPSGDSKKISTYSTALTTTTWSGGMTSAHWRVIWSSNANGYGVTEGGSSGSPLFNGANKLIVGTLTGGGSTCASPATADAYGKFVYHWDANGTLPVNQLKPWLDPLGLDPSSLDGFDPNEVALPPVADFSSNVTSAFVGDEISFSDKSTNLVNQWSWTFEGGYPGTSSIRNPVVQWMDPGTYTVSLNVSNPSGSNSTSKTGYITIYPLPSVPTTNPVVIGIDTSTGLYPFGIDGRFTSTANYVRSASIYTATEIGGGGIVSKLEWYVGTSRTDSRTIDIYLKHTSLSTFSAATIDDLIADATLVYCNAFVPNQIAWNGFDLQNDFAYDGTSNLMVIVLVNSGQTSNLTSACHYSNNADMHQQWHDNDGAPSGNGTVNGNRPNIRITFNSFSVPVANFAVMGNVFREDFEGSVFPPDGWTVINSDGGGSSWGSSASNNHTTGGVSSAFHKWGSLGYAETGWLITPQIVLASGGQYSLDFWSLNLDADYYGNNAVLVSTTGTSTSDFTQVWSPSAVSGEWENTLIDLTAYQGQNIYIAFRYQGTYTHGWLLDDISIGKLSYDPVTIFEGDELTFFDYSSNNPMVRKWSFPGSQTTESFEESPVVEYLTAGAYDVSLKAVNPVGSNTKTTSAFVTVVGRVPFANYSFESNLRTVDYKPFVPIDGLVAYSDASQRIPTSWSWQFNGGLPGSSNLANPEVQYPYMGVYPLSQTVSNAAGTDVKSIDEAVQVGGTAYVTNLYESDNMVGYTLSSGHFAGHGNYVSGITTYVFYEYAEFYENNYPGEIASLVFPVRSNLGTGKSVTFTVWDASSGVPGTVLGSKSVLISSLTPGSYNEVVFDAPISVSGDFFVGFVLNYDASHNYTTHLFSIYAAGSRAGSFAQTTTAWMKRGTTAANASWMPVSDFFTLRTSLSIEPSFTYTYTGPTLYSLSLSALPSEGGTVVDNTGAGIFAANTLVSLSTSPNTGYVFVNWMSDGTEVSINNAFTYTMPAANTNLEAHFARIGDASYDGMVNVIDVVWLVNHITGATPAGFLMVAADINKDGFADAVDLVAMVDIIMGGAKSFDLKSLDNLGLNDAYIHLNESGDIILTSDGTLSALQFRMHCPANSLPIIKLEDNSFQLAYRIIGDVINGVVYSMDNKAFVAGESILMHIEGVGPGSLEWLEVFASNQDAQRVNVYPSVFTGLNEDYSLSGKIMLYPNPGKGPFILSIELPQPMEVSVGFHDLTGREAIPEKIFQGKTGTNALTIQTANVLKPGVYLLKIKPIKDADKQFLTEQTFKVILVE